MLLGDDLFNDSRTCLTHSQEKSENQTHQQRNADQNTKIHDERRVIEKRNHRRTLREHQHDRNQNHKTN